MNFCMTTTIILVTLLMYFNLNEDSNYGDGSDTLVVKIMKIVAAMTRYDDNYSTDGDNDNVQIVEVIEMMENMVMMLTEE